MTSDDGYRGERDDLDRALSAGLADLAPAEPDATRALTALRPAMRRARTRHRVVQGSAVAAVVLVLGIGAALAAPSNKQAQVQVSTPPSTENTIDRARGTSTTTPDTTSVTKSTPATSARNNDDNATPNSQPTTPVRSNPIGGPAPTTPPATSPPAGTTPPTTAAPEPGSDHTYTSAGGRVTVHFANGKISLVSYVQNPGYTPTVHTNKADDIEVRFRKGSSGDGETSVRVRVTNGRLTPEIKN